MLEQRILHMLDDCGTMDLLALVGQPGGDGHVSLAVQCGNCSLPPSRRFGSAAAPAQVHTLTMWL